MKDCGQGAHLAFNIDSSPNAILPFESCQQTDNDRTVQPASLGSQSENTDSVNTVFDRRILNKQRSSAEPSSIKHNSDDPYVWKVGKSIDSNPCGFKKPDFIVGGRINCRTVKMQKMHVADNEKFGNFKILFDSEPGTGSFDEHCHDLMSRECHDIMTKECHIPPMTLVSEQELSLLSMASVESTNPPDTSDHGTSPSVLSVSSATSSKRLEWDSAADIGYQGANASSTSLSTLERITIGKYASSIALNDPDAQGDYHCYKNKGKYSKTSNYIQNALPAFVRSPEIYEGRRDHKIGLQNRLLLPEASPAASRGNRLKKAKPPSLQACTSDEESQSMSKVSQSPRRRLRKRSSLHYLDKENRKFKQGQCTQHSKGKSPSDRYSQSNKSCSLNELNSVAKEVKNNKQSISQIDLACLENENMGSRMKKEITNRNVLSVYKSTAGESYETSDLAINTTSGTLVQSSVSVPDSPENSSDVVTVDSSKKLEEDNGLSNLISQESFVKNLQREHGKVSSHIVESFGFQNDALTNPHPLSIVESKHLWDVRNLDNSRKMTSGSFDLDGELAVTPCGAALNSSSDQSSSIHDITQHPFSTPSQLDKQPKPDIIAASNSLNKTSVEEAVVLDLTNNSGNYSSVELEEFCFLSELSMGDELLPSNSKILKKADDCSGFVQLQALTETGTVGIQKVLENRVVSENAPEIAVVNNILFNLSIKLGKCLQTLSNKQSDSVSSAQFEKLNRYVKFIGTDSSNSKEIELKQEVAELIVDVVGELSTKHDSTALQKLYLHDIMDQTSDLLNAGSLAQFPPSTSMNVYVGQRSSVLLGTITPASSTSLYCLQGSMQAVVDHTHPNSPCPETASGIITCQNRQPSSPPLTTGSNTAAPNQIKSNGPNTNEMSLPTTSKTERSVTPVGREDVVAYQPLSSDQVYYMAVSAECASQPWSLRPTRGPLAAISATGPQSLPALRTTSRQQDQAVQLRGRKTRVASHQPVLAAGEHLSGNDPRHDEARRLAEVLSKKVDLPISQVPAFNEARQGAVSGKQSLEEQEKNCTGNQIAKVVQQPSPARTDSPGAEPKNKEDKKLDAKEIGRETNKIIRKGIEEIPDVEIGRQETKNRDEVRILAEKEVLAAVESATKRVIETNRTGGQHLFEKISDKSHMSRKLVASTAVNSVLAKCYGTSSVPNTGKEPGWLIAHENLSESLRALVLEPSDDGSSRELQSCVSVGPSQLHDPNSNVTSEGVEEFISSCSHERETRQECLFESPQESSTRGLVCRSPPQHAPLAPHNTTTLSALSLSSCNLGSSCRGYSASVSSVQSSNLHSTCSYSSMRSGSPVVPEKQLLVAKDTNSSEEEVAGLTSKVNCSSSFEGEIVSIMWETGISNRGPIVGACRRDFVNDGRVNSSKESACKEGSHDNDGINSTVEEKNLRSALYQNVQGHHIEHLGQLGALIDVTATRAGQLDDYTQQASRCSVAEALQEGVCMFEPNVPSRHSSELDSEGSVAAGNAELNTTFSIEKCLASPKSDPLSRWPTSEVVPLSHNNAYGSVRQWSNSGISVSCDDGAALHGCWPGTAPTPDAAYRPADEVVAVAAAPNPEQQAWSSSCSESAYETIRSKDRRLDEAVASSFEFYCTTSKDARAVGYTSSVDEKSRPADSASDSPRERQPHHQPVAGQPTQEPRRAAGFGRSAARVPPHAPNTDEAAAQSSTSSDQPADRDHGSSAEQRRRHLRKIQRYISTLERLERTLAAGTGSVTTTGPVHGHRESSRRKQFSSNNPDALGVRPRVGRHERYGVDHLSTTTTTDGGNSTGNSSGITKMEREVRKLEKLQQQIQGSRAAAGVMFSAEGVHKNDRDQRNASPGRCRALSVETNHLLVGELTKIRLEDEESKDDTGSIESERDRQMYEGKQISTEQRGMDIPLSARAVDYIRSGVDVTHPYDTDANNLPIWGVENHPPVGDVNEQFKRHNYGDAHLRHESYPESEASPVGEAEDRLYQPLLKPSSSSDLFNVDGSELKLTTLAESVPSSPQAVDSIDFQSHRMVPDTENLKASAALGPDIESTQDIRLNLATGSREVHTDILQSLMMESSLPLMTSTVRGTSGRPSHFKIFEKSLYPDNAIGTVDTNRTSENCSVYEIDTTNTEDVIKRFPSASVIHQNPRKTSVVFTAADLSFSNVNTVTSETGPTFDIVGQPIVPEHIHSRRLNNITRNEDQVFDAATARGPEQQVDEDGAFLVGRARRSDDRKSHEDDVQCFMDVSTRIDSVPLAETLFQSRASTIDLDGPRTESHFSKERLFIETRDAPKRSSPSRKKPEPTPVYTENSFERSRPSFHHGRLVDHVHQGNSFPKVPSLSMDKQKRLCFQTSVAVQTGDSLLSSLYQHRPITATIATTRAELRDVSSQCTRDAPFTNEQSSRSVSYMDGQDSFKVDDKGSEKMSDNQMDLGAGKGSRYMKTKGLSSVALSDKNYADKENINIGAAGSEVGFGVRGINNFAGRGNGNVVRGEPSPRRNSHLLKASLGDANYSGRGHRSLRKQNRNTPRSFQSSGSDSERLGSAAQRRTLKSKLDAKFGVAVSNLELLDDGGDISKYFYGRGRGERSPRTSTEFNARNDQPLIIRSSMHSKGFLSHTAKRLQDRERNKANQTLVSDQPGTSSSRRSSRANQSEDGSSSAVPSTPSSIRLWQPLGRENKTSQSGAGSGDTQRSLAAGASQASTELTLQEALLLSKPQFVAAAEERRARITRHQSLRREAQRYNAHLITTLPPALHTPRTLQSLMYRPAMSPVVPYRELRAQNRRLVTRLPEARRANRQRELQALARANRIRKELYSQKLRSKAIKGEVAHGHRDVLTPSRS